jgi:hypothetical protein
MILTSSRTKEVGFMKDHAGGLELHEPKDGEFDSTYDKQPTASQPSISASLETVNTALSHGLVTG